MKDKKKEEIFDSNEKQGQKELQNDFLKEIHQKINKRSGGLYYNKKLKSIKKSLSITSFAVIFIIILWALINFISQKVSLSNDIKINKTTGETHGRASQRDDKKVPASQRDDKKVPASQRDDKKGRASQREKPSKGMNKHKPLQEKNNNIQIKKQKYRYIFTKSKDFDINNLKILKKILKKYNKLDEKEYYIYIIPDIEFKNVLQLILKMKLTLKKEEYSDINNNYQISIKKEILD